MSGQPGPGDAYILRVLNGEEETGAEAKQARERAAELSGQITAALRDVLAAAVRPREIALEEARERALADALDRRDKALAEAVRASQAATTAEKAYTEALADHGKVADRAAESRDNAAGYEKARQLAQALGNAEQRTKATKARNAAREVEQDDQIALTAALDRLAGCDQVLQKARQREAATRAALDHAQEALSRPMPAELGEGLRALSLTLTWPALLALEVSGALPFKLDLLDNGFIDGQAAEQCDARNVMPARMKRQIREEAEEAAARRAQYTAGGRAVPTPLGTVAQAN